MPNIRWLIAFITKVHRALYLRTNGWIGARVLHMRFLLLTHRGRRSGLERVTPLLCVEDGHRWIVAASNGGDDREPAWWLNLQARPEAVVQFGGERTTVKAREASEAENAELWTRLEASYSYYDRYRERTSRHIAVVVLDRTA